MAARMQRHGRMAANVAAAVASPWTCCSRATNSQMLAASASIFPHQHRMMASTVKVTPPPHPDWKPGEKQPMPKEVLGGGHVAIDPNQEKSVYPLMISAVVPRPIAFISSCGGPGGRNLAPYSYFGAVAHDPPMVAIGLCRKGGREDRKKDTFANIEATGQFVVNLMSEWFVEAANHTCGDFPPEVDEMSLSGLTPVASEKVEPDRVGEAAVSMECRVAHTYDVRNASGAVTTTVVLGEVLLFHVAEGILAETPSSKSKMVRFDGLQPMARLGGDTYGRVTSTFDLPRPDRSSK